MATVNYGKISGMKSIIIETNTAKIEIIPERGGNIRSLFHKPTNRHVLWRNRELDVRKPTGDEKDYKPFNSGGWDECFPTIAPTVYYGRSIRGIPLPDHGELWNANWDAEVLDLNDDKKSVLMRMHGRALPYSFERTITLFDRDEKTSHLTLGYRVTNEANEDMNFLWAAQPLFEAEKGYIIDLPEVSQVTVVQSFNLNLGPKGSKIGWPVHKDVSGSLLELNKFGWLPNTAYKVFAKINHGLCRVIDNTGTHYVEMHFDENPVPFVGVWMNQGLDMFGLGGQEREGEERMGHISVQPSSGMPDSLEEARNFGTYKKIPAKSTIHWSLDCIIT